MMNRSNTRTFAILSYQSADVFFSSQPYLLFLIFTFLLSRRPFSCEVCHRNRKIFLEFSLPANESEVLLLLLSNCRVITIFEFARGEDIKLFSLLFESFSRNKKMFLFFFSCIFLLLWKEKCITSVSHC